MKFFLRRILLAIPMLWGVLTLLFLLVHAMPGDASNHYFHPHLPAELADKMRENLGLDDSIWTQYFRWLGAAMTLDFQYSLITHRPALAMIAEALPRTLLLSGVSLLLIYGLGIALGIASAFLHGKTSGKVLDLVCLLGLSMPSFFASLLLIFVFAFDLGWFPISGTSAINADLLSPGARLLDGLWHLCLPALALAMTNAPVVARYARQGILDAMGQDFVRTARAKGLEQGRLLQRHVLRGALLPLITLGGLQLPFLVSGAVLVETVFSWNGMGRLLVESILQRDTPVVLAAVFFLSALVIVGSVLADALYRVADPRIRES